MRDNPFSRWLASLSGSRRRSTVLVKELGERDRRRMLRHFMGLDDSDRLLRFGTVLPDEQLQAYVARIDFGNDIVLGGASCR
jgi:hypothetical protein